MQVGSRTWDRNIVERMAGVSGAGRSGGAAVGGVRPCLGHVWRSAVRGRRTIGPVSISGQFPHDLFILVHQRSVSRATPVYS